MQNEANSSSVQSDSVENSYRELMHFIEKYPVLFPILHSTLFIQILRYLKNAKDLIMLGSVFPYIEREDLLEILALLEKIGLVSRFKATNKDFYYLTDLGKRFIELYDKTRLAILRGGLKELKV
ncbi:MAG: hypothetical protein N3F05_00295 [Candidatus Diapherotrites archaeon]|nr:hypothetical protein [Candidatus Diapherotrites archaeon]